MYKMSWKVYGEYGHRQKESFNSSFIHDFSRPGNIRIIEVENSDKTGTHKYSIIRITRNTKEECIGEFYGQLSDGVFENCRTGYYEEI